MLQNQSETTDQDRVKAITVAFLRAEADLDLLHGSDLALRDRVERIVRTAQGCPLDPRLYRIVWCVRSKLAATKGEAA